MFLGEYQHTLDAKGRITIPAKLREGLGDKFIVTKGLDNCLFLYPLDEWRVLEEKLRTLPFTRKDVRAFVRFFFSGASDCEADRQGRIVLPAGLREYARIDKEVIIVGVGSRVEVWAKELWENYLQDAGDSYVEIAEKLDELGF
ncbi:MAG: division/cell wall cluster transcriptional repressor MraZ [Syntrophomonadaceae bacterium]|nr:division/cell wall cluster transcriptional repressor MraZ [Syntrophomonadaceae bacterium]